MNRLLFEKRGDAVYLSHLDLMRVFQRAFKRADILIWHSQGFSPRAYVSIALPLPVGMESRCEILDFEIEDGAVELPALAGRLNAVLPAGIRVLSAYESARKVKELTRLQAEITLEYDGGIPEGAQQALGAFFARESIVITKHSKKGDKEVDIKPLLHSLEMTARNPKRAAAGMRIVGAESGAQSAAAGFGNRNVSAGMEAGLCAHLPHGGTGRREYPVPIRGERYARTRYPFELDAGHGGDDCLRRQNFHHGRHSG